MSVKLLVNNADDLRDALSTSGLFEMSDCVLFVDCPLVSDVQEVGQMINIVESAIHVVDIEVSSYTDGDEYVVEMVEVPVGVAEGRTRKK